MWTPEMGETFQSAFVQALDRVVLFGTYMTGSHGVTGASWGNGIFPISIC